MAKGDDIQERLVNFAVNVIRFCGTFPRTDVGKHLAGQLLRCGTSPAPNYAEARGAETRNDFVHKLGIVQKELNETGVWLQIAVRSGIRTGKEVDDLQVECDELSRIIGASIRTVGKKQNSLTISH